MIEIKGGKITEFLENLTEDCPELKGSFLGYIEAIASQDVTFQLAEFHVPAMGFCGNQKNIYISEDLVSGKYPGVMLLFIMLHEVMHTNHDWKEACDNDYEGFKETVVKYEQEANDFAIDVLGELKKYGLQVEINILISSLIPQIEMMNDRFDEGYKPVFETYGADLSINDIATIL